MIKELTKEKHLKYILSDLQDYANGKFASPLELVDIECELLLNYITNLQKENEKLKETLQTDKLMKAFMVEHNRNEKAVEYIRENEQEYGSLLDNEKIILNILEGGDE